MSTFKTVILPTEYSKEQIRGPDYLKRVFEHMMKSINAVVASAFSDYYQDKTKRIIGIEVQWCVDYGPRNLDGDVGYWKVIAEVEDLCGGEMETQPQDSVNTHAATEMKRVAPDVIAVAEEGPRSIAGSNPARTTK